MSHLDHLLPRHIVPRRRSRDTTVHRTVLCAVMATVEALAVVAVLFSAALFYHLAFLGFTIDEFAAPFYAMYAVIAGAFHGTFAALAQDRFLHRRQVAHAGGRDAAYAWTAALALTLLTAFLLGQIGDLSRVSLTLAYVLAIPVVIAVRATTQAAVGKRIREGGLHFESVSVIGNRVDLLNFLIHGELWRNGHRLTNTLYLEDVRGEDGSVQAEAITKFATASLRAGTDHIVFVGALSDLDELERMASHLKRFAVNVLYAPATGNRSLKFIDVVSIGPNNVLRFLRTPMSDGAVIFKRATDVAGSLLGLLVLSPLFLLVALAIKLESPGPVIFRQARRGFNGETFMIWKFRSMRVTESGHAMRQARKNDPRVTRVGAFIRRTSIDELPQLVNVLIGQMSLVGPRPHAVCHDDELAAQVAEYAHRQRIRPGITGWAQVNGFRGETSRPDHVEGRIAHDIYYIENWSVFLDVWTLLLTVFSPASRRNAH